MTIATSSTEEFSIDRIVLQAYRMAGAMPLEQGATGVQWTARATAGREFLELLVKSLETEGRLVKARRFYTFPLTTGTSDYTMPASILDVYGPAAFIPDGQDPTAASTEYVVNQISLEEWQLLGTRDLTGVPSMYTVDRSGASAIVKLWPAPDDEGYIRVQANYLLANSTSGQDTVELERHWSMYLVYGLATMIAEATQQPRDKVQALELKAQVLLQKALNYSRERVPYQFVVRHNGVWR